MASKGRMDVILAVYCSSGLAAYMEGDERLTRERRRSGDIRRRCEVKVVVGECFGVFG